MIEFFIIFLGIFLFLVFMARLAYLSLPRCPDCGNIMEETGYKNDPYYCPSCDFWESTCYKRPLSKKKKV